MKNKLSKQMNQGHWLYIMLAAVIFCGCSQKLDEPKYKIGDVVYMKPDSVKVLIIDDDVAMGEYEIEYSGTNWVRHYCDESDIYGAELSKK